MTVLKCMFTCAGTVLLEPVMQTTTQLKKKIDSRMLFKTLACGIECPSANKDETQCHSKFPHQM